MKKWSGEELRFIKENPTLSYEELSEKLNRTVLGVKQIIWSAKGRLLAITALIVKFKEIL